MIDNWEIPVLLAIVGGVLPVMLAYAYEDWHIRRDIRLVEKKPVDAYLGDVQPMASQRPRAYKRNWR